jgi:hypothetical protein
MQRKLNKELSLKQRIEEKIDLKADADKEALRVQLELEEQKK